MINTKESHTYNTKNIEYDKFFTFYDWKGAYDHVDHDILMNVLKTTGASYLCLRFVSIILFHCRASLDGINFFRIEKGVP